MVSRNRWDRAQKYELSYWAGQADQIAKGTIGQLDWYQWRADHLLSRLNALGYDSVKLKGVKVIEVGSGPLGLTGFFPAGERLLVDPLEGFYANNTVLSSLRNSAAVYKKGSGEDLPAPSGHYDLAVIENCIDHVKNVDAVMKELVRVLKPEGLLYITVNCRTPLGFLVHRLLSRLRLDPGHPHTFTPPKFSGLIKRFGFEVLDMTVGSFNQARQEDLASNSRRARLKAHLGISEFLASAIARRRPPDPDA